MLVRRMPETVREGGMGKWKGGKMDQIPCGDDLQYSLVCGYTFLVDEKEQGGHRSRGDVWVVATNKDEGGNLGSQPPCQNWCLDVDGCEVDDCGAASLLFGRRCLLGWGS